MSEFSKKYYLDAIITEIRLLRGFVHGMDFDDYADDIKTQYACERGILNLSEAVRNFEKHGKRYDSAFDLNSISAEIEWQKLKGIGNVMRHDYENVTSSRVWSVLVEHLKDLEKACEQAIENQS